LLDIWINLIARMAAESILDLFGLGTPGALDLGSLFGAGAGTTSAVTAAGAAGTGVAVGTAIPGAGGLAVTGPSIATGGIVPVHVASTAPAVKTATVPGAASVSGGAAAAGTGAGLALGAGALAFGYVDLFQQQQSISDMLGTVEPMQLALAGVNDEFTAIGETMAGPMSDAFMHFDAISVDTQAGVMVLGDTLNIVNGTIGTSIQVWDEATGTWQESTVSMQDMIERMRELDATTNMSTEAIARMVAAEAGLPSLSDELAGSYKALGAATSELAKTSTAAASAISEAAGNVVAAQLELREDLANKEITEHEFNKGMGALDEFQTGTDYVPQTGLYRLHAGEAVLTPEENRMRNQPQQVVIPVSVGGQHLETIVVDLADEHIVTREERGLTGRLY
jgi:hypothetical protein